MIQYLGNLPVKNQGLSIRTSSLTDIITEKKQTASRLFLGSGMAMLTTAISVAIIAVVLPDIKNHFQLSIAQIEWLSAAALITFAASQLVFSAMCEKPGMRFLLRAALLSHLIGIGITISASEYPQFVAGILIIAMASGLVKAASNPLIVALYPENKTTKLNHLHAWIPIGIAIGGLATYILDLSGSGSWQIKVGVILIPVMIYGILLFNQAFPGPDSGHSENSFKTMLSAAFLTPLMLTLLFAMALAASLESGPDQWLPKVLDNGGIPTILSLIWISGIFALMRFKAGNALQRFSSIGLLLISAIISSFAFLGLSYSNSGFLALFFATVFAIGASYLWPTLLGVVSERIPKSGALGLGLMGATGLLVAGLLAAPIMSDISDYHAHEKLSSKRTKVLFEVYLERVYPHAMIAQGGSRWDLKYAADISDKSIQFYDETRMLPIIQTARAVRAIANTGLDVDFVEEANELIGPADLHGGRISMRYLLIPSLILCALFAALHYRKPETK